jgi:hypothetical protein
MSYNNLSEQQYSALGVECDKILLSYEDKDQVVAIDSLHATREGSLFFRDAPYLFFKNNFFYITNRRIKTIIKYILFFFYSLIRSFSYKNPCTENTGNNADFLFISHYTGSHDDSEFYQDSYFGEVVNQLSKNSNKCVVAYINHTKDNSIVFQKDESVVKILIDNFCSFSQIFYIYKDIFLTFIPIAYRSNALHARIVRQARINIFSPGTIRNLIICNQVKSIINTFHPKTVVTTYEGYAWERLVFSSSRDVDENIKCIAYQHAPLFKFQHSIRRSIGKKYNPDIILTSGLYSRDQLRLSKKISDTKIFALGSGRNIIPEEKYQFGAGMSCLVIPEGSVKECDILFDFSLKCAFKNPHITFVWRLPPMISLNLLIKYNNIFLNLPSNIVISKISLLGDISRSKLALYRGSSAIIQSVVLGLKPIYLKIHNELTIDVLYGATGGREIVSSIEEFESTLLKNTNIDAQKELIEFCKNVYTNLDITILEDILCARGVK